jgi:hypothetical protein
MKVKISMAYLALFIFSLTLSGCFTQGDDSSTATTATTSNTTDTGTGTDPGSTAPTTSITVTDSGGGTCTYSGSIYNCDGGGAAVTVTFTADETATIYYDSSTDSEVSVTTSDDSVDTSGDANFTGRYGESLYVKYFATGSTGTESENSATIYFTGDTTQFTNITCAGVPVTGGGYCNNDVFFNLQLSSSVSTNSDYIRYRLLSRKITGTDVSGDTSGDTVFDSGTTTANTNSDPYMSTYSGDNWPESAIEANYISGETTIFQYNANILHGGSTTNAPAADATTDSDMRIVFYLDTDKPNLMAIPPSSGSMSSSMKVIPFIQDNGDGKIRRYAQNNRTLSQFAPIQNMTSWYCYTTEASNDAYGNDFSLVPNGDFWDECDSARNSYTADTQLTFDENAYIGFSGTDPATNNSECDGNSQFACAQNQNTSNQYIVEYYTPGLQKTSVYHDFEYTSGDDNQTNFGYSTLTTDLDGDGYDNDIVIGAPAYSYTSDSDATEDRGAVYIWYNEFRERAQIRLALGGATMDVSGDANIVFQTDGGSSLTVHLDPSHDTLGLGLASDYADKTAANAYEIAKVFNRVFMNSDGKSRNYLFAMATDASNDLLSSTFNASKDGYITIGHINRTISGYFTMTSSTTFDTSSDFNFGTKTVRAYDYAFFGETDNDEFGYALAAGTVDGSTDSGYSQKQLLVGAPGYATNDGAVYVLKLPASDASADYGQVNLARASGLSTDAHRILDTSSDERFGSTVLVFDRDSDSTADLFIGAPYAGGAVVSGACTGNKCGKVYYKSGRDYDFASATDTTSSTSTLFDTLSGSSDDGLFGSSMVIGATNWSVGNGSANHLYVGAPGERDGSVEGYFAMFGVDSSGLLSTQDFNGGNTTREYDKEFESENRNLFGYSLSIVDSSFGTNACPCLLVGAPGSGVNDNGKLWMYGDVFRAFIEGDNDSDLLGSSIHVGTIDSIGNNHSIIIGARDSGGGDQKGKFIILRPQSAVGDPETAGLTAESLSYTPQGALAGENFGHSISIVEYNSSGDKALILGAPGEHYTGGSSYQYHRPGIEHNQKGSVQIISATKLGF